MKLTDQYQKQARVHFEDYAASGKWHSLYEKGHESFSLSFALRLQHFAELMRQVQPKKVLDTGCGTGDFLYNIPPSVNYYVGVDFAEEMVLRAQSKWSNTHKLNSSVLNVKFKTGDIMKLKAEEQYDFVLASGLTEYFDVVQPVIFKLASFVKKGGHVAVQTPNRTFWRWKGQHKIYNETKQFAHHRLSFDELDAFAEAAGLRKVCGDFINHSLPYFPALPVLHKLSNALLSRCNSKSLSAKTASQYIGMYVKE